MKKRRNTTPSKPKLTQDQIDRFVTAQADVDSAWQKAIVVTRPKCTSLSIPSELAARAAFLARLHRESRVDKWVEQIFWRALQRCEVDAGESVFVGDDPETDIEGARLAGMLPIWKHAPSRSLVTQDVLTVHRLVDILPICLRE